MLYDFRDLFFYTELIHRLLLVTLTRIQYHTGEIGTVRCIWEVLCLQTYSRATRECCAISTLITTGIVGCVELHARLCRVALQRSSTLGIFDLGCKTELTLFHLIQYIVMVKALTELNLLIISVNILAKGFRGTEIKWFSESHQ